MASPMFSHPIWELMFRTLSNNHSLHTRVEGFGCQDLGVSVPERCGIQSTTQNLQNQSLPMQGLSSSTDTS